MPTAVIFDFDGVLADTEPLHFAAFRDTLAADGLPLTWADYERDLIGFDDRDVFRTVYAAAGRAPPAGGIPALIEAKGRRFAELCRASDLRPLPGAAALVDDVRRRVPMAICSGARPADIELVLDLFGWRGAFPVCVTAADVAESKPNPAGYALAVRRLRDLHPDRGIRADRTVAIEDTDAGVAAARAAGLQVVRVGKGPRGPTDGVWRAPTLTQVDWEYLRRAVGE